MRDASALGRSTSVLSRRFRPGLLLANKCRRPGRDRITLPVAVTLKRLATDFFVFWFLARRMRRSKFRSKERAT